MGARQKQRQHQLRLGSDIRRPHKGRCSEPRRAPKCSRGRPPKCSRGRPLCALLWGRLDRGRQHLREPLHSARPQPAPRRAGSDEPPRLTARYALVGIAAAFGPLLPSPVLTTLLVNELVHEIDAYADFCDFRLRREETYGSDDDDATREEWMESRRRALHDRMRRRRQRRVARSRGATRKSPISLW